jgi:hypothetical protein
VTAVVDALDGAFYAAFGNVEPSGARMLLALDRGREVDTFVIYTDSERRGRATSTRGRRSASIGSAPGSPRASSSSGWSRTVHRR